LEVPKKVIQYVPAAVPVVDPSKAKQAKAKVARGPQRQFKPAKSALPEVASIYAEGHDSDADQPASKRARVSLGKSSGEEEARRPVGAPAEVAHEKINRRAIPANFYAVVAPLFKEFWEMEFDSDEVTYAFFARITNLNAKDFKLNAFAERSYCLEVIKVCINIPRLRLDASFLPWVTHCTSECTATGKVEAAGVRVSRRLRVRFLPVVR
jgi:hypothetical protein